MTEKTPSTSAKPIVKRGYGDKTGELKNRLKSAGSKPGAETPAAPAAAQPVSPATQPVVPATPPAVPQSPFAKAAKVAPRAPAAPAPNNPPVKADLPKTGHVPTAPPAAKAPPVQPVTAPAPAPAPAAQAPTLPDPPRSEVSDPPLEFETDHSDPGDDGIDDASLTALFSEGAAADNPGPPSVAVAAPPPAANTRPSPAANSGGSVFAKYANISASNKPASGKPASDFSAYRAKFSKILSPYGMQSDNLAITMDPSASLASTIDWPYKKNTAGSSDWLDVDRPAGSRYSNAEWEDAEQGGKFVVMEVVNQGQSALIRVNAPPQMPPEPKVKHPSWRPPEPPAIPANTFDYVGADFYSRTMLVQEGAEHSYPGRVSAKVVLEWPLGVQVYDVVRSEASAANHPHYMGALWTEVMSAEKLSDVAKALFAASAEPTSAEEESSASERMRP